MKKLIKFLTLAMILIIASCSAEIVNNLSKEEIDETDSVQAYTRYDGSQLEVFFEPNAFARSYGYQIDNGSTNPVPSLTAAGNWYTFSIPLAELQSSSNGTITIYGRTQGSSDWKKTSSTEYDISNNAIAPEAYFSRRNENSAEIYLSSFFNDPSYKLEITNSTGVTTTIEGNDINIDSNNIVTVEDLDTNEKYVIIVYHKENGSSNYNAGTTQVDIPAYTNTSTINLTLTDNGFSIENAGSSAELWKKDSASSSFEGTKVADIISDKIPFTDLKSLESGYFYVRSGETISNIVKATTPLTLVSDPIVNYKSVVLEFDFAEDATNLTFNVLNGSEGSEANIDEVNRNIVKIEGLNSNTSFTDLGLDITNTEYSSVENLSLNQYNIKTKSFAGETGEAIYTWTGTLVKGSVGTKPTHDTNFCIRVIEAPDQSTYPYYVYFTKEDDAITNKESYDDNPLRIMPLIDEKIDNLSLDITINCKEPATGYKKANDAYLANASKWNSTEYDTQDWKIISDPPTSRNDDVTTTTESTALLGTTPVREQQTITEFHFMEFDVNEDGQVEPVIKFKNTGVKLVSLGVFSNGSNDSDIYANADTNETQKQYCWYLAKK